jgi:aspartate-semialdehyde dehydrogenase
MAEISIAVVGATGAVGREFLKILEERRFPAGHVKLLASARSAGTLLAVNGQELVVRQASPDSFEGVDIAFISVNSRLSGELGPAAVEAGALVIDDSSFFRMRPEVPLVVPEVNGEDVEWHQGVISIPNCSTTPLVMVAQPLHRVNPISRIIADTYQSVSGAGGAAMAELREQTRAILEGAHPAPRVLPHQIAFNVIPRIDDFTPDGYTREEQKMREETRKIMHAPGISVSATCVRVPVYVSHSASVHLELERPMAPEEARDVLRGMPGVVVVDEPQQGLYPMPWDVAGTDDVYVGRVRKDASHHSGLVLWVTADNLRKGAALNAIQIAEEVLRRDCLKPRKVSASAGYVKLRKGLHVI